MVITTHCSKRSDLAASLRPERAPALPRIAAARERGKTSAQASLAARIHQALDFRSPLVDFGDLCIAESAPALPRVAAALERGRLQRKPVSPRAITRRWISEVPS
ncbi:conserved hypothetical protein [Xanthomonas citri pv. citri]|nr:conserved hypothetical protein [Xanthomonas citri pv. citri]CEE84247.1 conserved hypothetical protein [Xanthomonas citri pv. citri]